MRSMEDQNEQERRYNQLLTLHFVPLAHAFKFTSNILQWFFDGPLLLV